MPIYPYQCPACVKPAEIMKSISDFDRKEYCEHCSVEMQRQMAQTAPPQFKGRGFYATDYGRKTK